jgi:lipoprotein-anchoring transpeptidase ErfK/SrfK
MQRVLVATLMVAASALSAQAQQRYQQQQYPQQPQYQPQQQYAQQPQYQQQQYAPQQRAPQPQYAARQSNLGGGFIEFLFGGLSSGDAPPPAPAMMQAPDPRAADQDTLLHQAYAPPAPAVRPSMTMDPKFLPQIVAYDGTEPPGTIIINTPERFLYLVEAGGRAKRYGIGVGRPGFAWAGEHKITAKREWPDWRPPDDMLKRRPDLPHFMPGGPENPLGARALYLGSTLYRIHGSNEPWTIGQAVSSGCIRMRNEDVIDLYGRVGVGTTVVVI